MQTTRGVRSDAKIAGGWILAFILIAAAVAAGVFVPVAAVAATPIGTPAIQRFAHDLEVYPRNFAVTQGPSGIVYVGNVEGVLSFDGTRWHRHATSDDEIARTLAHDGDGRLYVGGYDGFGYFETPLAPDSKYIDLLPAFGISDPDFADIWQLEVTSIGVFFVALDTLFWLDPETGATRHWEHPGRFGALAEIDGEVFVQYRGEGMRVWRDGEFEPVANTQALSEQVFNLLALPGGGFLTTARDGVWRIFRDGEVSEFPHPEVLPQSSYFTSAAMLDDGLIALGSIDGWLYFLDPVNHSFESFRLTRDWIADLHATREGGLIAQTDLETLYIRWPAKWTAWGADHGLTGNVMEVLRWRDRWLVISNGGALMSGAAMPVGFEPMSWTDFEAWDFLPLDDGTGLFAESYMLKHVDLDGVIQEIDSVQYPRVIEPGRFDESLFFVGTEQGLGVLRRGADGFEHVSSGGEELGGVFTIVEMEPGLLMLGTQNHGVFEARFDASFETLELTERNQGIMYGDADYAELALLGGQVHAVTEDSIWRWNGEGFEPARIEGLEAIRSQGKHLEVREGPDGDLWAYDFGNVHRLTERGWQEMEIGPLYRGALSSIDFDDSGRVFVGASGSVVIFDPGASELGYTGHDVMLRSVKLDDRSGEIRRLKPGVQHPVPAGSFSIRFDYSLPGVHGRNEVRYKARLTGYEPEFSRWEPTSHYTYLNLQPGEYVFEVLGRGPSGRVSEIEPFEFRVVPPWHRAPWILNLRWPGVALLFALLIWLYMRARVWRLEGERKRLATKVRQRTQALVAANRKLKEMAEIDQLTGIANRRSFDQYLRQQIARCHAGGRPMALALIDLDQFKPYNDRHGHLAGDEVLRDIAHCLGEGFGNDESQIARFGGDEFAAVLPGQDLEGARAMAERARGYCAKACGEVKLSIGIAAVRPGRQVDSVGLLEAADHQLYEIKRAGRNGIATAWVDSD